MWRRKPAARAARQRRPSFDDGPRGREAPAARAAAVGGTSDSPRERLGGGSNTTPGAWTGINRGKQLAKEDAKARRGEPTRSDLREADPRVAAKKAYWAENRHARGAGFEAWSDTPEARAGANAAADRAAATRQTAATRGPSRERARNARRQERELKKAAATRRANCAEAGMAPSRASVSSDSEADISVSPPPSQGAVSSEGITYEKSGGRLGGGDVKMESEEDKEATWGDPYYEDEGGESEEAVSESEADAERSARKGQKSVREELAALAATLAESLKTAAEEQARRDAAARDERARAMYAGYQAAKRESKGKGGKR